MQLADHYGDQYANGKQSSGSKRNVFNHLLRSERFFCSVFCQLLSRD
jgi:hypothetical protein